MGKLADAAAAQIHELETERRRILRDANTNVAAIDRKLAELDVAAKVLTPEVEEAYEGLLRLGLIQAVTTR